MVRWGLSTCCLFACALASAQTPPAFVGTWKVTWQGARPLEARLVVSESGGTWQTFATSRTDPCVGREVPIAFEEINGDEATVRLKFSEALRVCVDITIRIKKLSEKALAGTRGATVLTITRD